MTTTAPSQTPLHERLAKELSRGTSDLPTLPRGATEALRLARMPSIDFDDFARIAAADPPLAARIVSVANSAAYAPAGRSKLASVRQAAVRIGLQATRDVLYQVAYSSVFVEAPGFRDRIEVTFQHGAAVARMARRFARARGLDADVAFLAGLLHDLGRARCWKLVARHRDKAVTLDVAIAAVDDLHCIAGAELAAAWRLPEEVVEACRWHHEPAPRSYPLLVAAGDALAPFDEERGDSADARDLLLEAGVPADQVDDLVAKASEEERSHVALGTPRDADKVV